MPGISQGYSMAAHTNIERAIRNTYSDPGMRKDAFKVLELTEKAHIWEDRMLESQIQVVRYMFKILSVTIIAIYVITFVAALSKNSYQVSIEMILLDIVLVTVVFLTWLEPRWSAKRIKMAKDELDSLSSSKPKYWEPLIARVTQIAIIYGNAEHSLIGSRQVTVLKNEKK